eukprot:403095_1
MAKRKKTNTNKPSTTKQNDDGPEATATTGDWLSALVKESSSSSNSNKILSKKKRIEKRNAKKLRREERRGVANSTTKKNRQNELNHRTEEEMEQTRAKSQFYMEDLSDRMQSTVRRITKEMKETSSNYRVAKPFISKNKGKATAGQQLDDSVIQPRRRDYGGLGLARPSLLLDLRDMSFVPKLEQEFAEHIPGFFGKQRTKAMKKQLDGNMLWRRLQQQKQFGEDTNGRKNHKHNYNVKFKGKKLSEMSADDRVE